MMIIISLLEMLQMRSDDYHHPDHRCWRTLLAMLRLRSDAHLLCILTIYISKVTLGTVGDSDAYVPQHVHHQNRGVFIFSYTFQVIGSFGNAEDAMMIVIMRVIILIIFMMIIITAITFIIVIVIVIIISFFYTFQM